MERTTVQLPTSKRIMAIRTVLIMALSILLSLNFLNAQELNYPIKNVNGIACYVYTVKQSEGFYRIGKTFNTTEEIIKGFNPETKEGLKVGMKLYIPITPATSPEVSYIEHVVEKKQTLYRICRIYKVSEEELLALNPAISNRSLSTGQVLKIPIKPKQEGIATISKSDDQSIDIDKKPNKEQQKNTEDFIGVHPTPKSDTLNIAFLLTFMLDQQTELSDNRFVEFYAGALVAIQKAKGQGINFNIYTYDVEKSDLKLMEVLQDSIFNKVDLIVGPAYSNQVSIISDFARNNKIKTLIPFSAKIYDIETNPYLYQFNPGLDIERNKLQEIIKTQKSYQNIIFADLPNVNNINDDGFVLSAQLREFMSDNNMNFQTVNLNQEYLENLKFAINPNTENLLIFNTSRLTSLAPYINQMNDLADSSQLKIYEPYAWRTSKMKRPNSLYLSPFKSDFNGTSYEAYMQTFDRLFDWTPTSESPRYDVLGYDLMHYFIRFVLKKNQLPPTVYTFSTGIQSDVKFERTRDKGGYINKSLNQFE